MANQFQIEISPRKRQLKEEYERLQAEFTRLVAIREDMVHSESPYLESLYMEEIGQYKYEILSLQYEISLLKMERDMYQSYTNRGEKPDVVTVQVKVQEQAETFNENLRQEEEKIKQAKAFLGAKKENENKKKDAEKIELKQLYKELVHRLHPDLHPEQTEWERELFLKIQDAYQQEDLEKIRGYAAELDAGMPSDSVDSNTVEEWEERVSQLKEQIDDIKEEIDVLNQSFPFTFREKLYDAEWLSAMQEDLRVSIERLTEEKERLVAIVEYMRSEQYGK